MQSDFNVNPFAIAPSDCPYQLAQSSNRATFLAD
jgi:hypothetical protein